MVVTSGAGTVYPYRASVFYPDYPYRASVFYPAYPYRTPVLYPDYPYRAPVFYPAYPYRTPVLYPDLNGVHFVQLHIFNSMCVCLLATIFA